MWVLSQGVPQAWCSASSREAHGPTVDWSQLPLQGLCQLLLIGLLPLLLDPGIGDGITPGERVWGVLQGSASGTALLATTQSRHDCRQSPLGLLLLQTEATARGQRAGHF